MINQKSTISCLATLFLMIAPCVAAEETGTVGSNIQGTATLTRGGTQIRACDEIFLFPAAKSAGLVDGTNDHLKMDWSFYDRLQELRAAAVSIASCRPDGSFEFHDIARGELAIVAHFSWLRGKRSTGGSLVRQINVPSASPLSLRAHLDD